MNGEEKDMETPLKFKVEKLNLRLPDWNVCYEAKVFVPQKAEGEMTAEERERYKRLLNAIGEFRIDLLHPNNYIDAEEYEESEVFTLDEMEKIFSQELEIYDKYLKDKEERVKELKQILKKKREEALKKALIDIADMRRIKIVVEGEDINFDKAKKIAETIAEHYNTKIKAWWDNLNGKHYPAIDINFHTEINEIAMKWHKKLKELDVHSSVVVNSDYIFYF